LAGATAIGLSIMRYAVIGVGGVGGLVGGLLARHGLSVTWVARGAHGAALRSPGLRVRSILGDFEVPTLDVQDSVRGLREVDVALVCVKGWQLPTVASELTAATGFDGVAVPLLNGVDSTSVLEAAIGRDRTAGGLCRMVSEIEAPGIIRHWAVPPSAEFGELDGHRSERITALAADFNASGIKATVSANIQTAVWEKAAFISSWGALCAACRAPVGEVRSNDEGARVLRCAVEEIVAVADAEGVRVGPDCVDRTMANIVALDASATSSLQRDLAAGRSSELDWQIGAILKRAERRAVPVPTLSALYSILSVWSRRMGSALPC